MLATFIQKYDKKSFHFLSSSRTRLKFYRLSDATYDRINTMYQFIKPWIKKKKKKKNV